MDQLTPSMTSLFEQLGLPSSPAEIASFIQSHQPLSMDISLSDAPFWTESQASFIKQKLRADDDWAVVVDKLNTSLRAHPDINELATADQ